MLRLMEVSPSLFHYSSGRPARSTEIKQLSKKALSHRPSCVPYRSFPILNLAVFTSKETLDVLTHLEEFIEAILGKHHTKKGIELYLDQISGMATFTFLNLALEYRLTQMQHQLDIMPEASFFSLNRCVYSKISPMDYPEDQEKPLLEQILQFIVGDSDSQSKDVLNIDSGLTIVDKVMLVLSAKELGVQVPDSVSLRLWDMIQRSMSMYSIQDQLKLVFDASSISSPAQETQRILQEDLSAVVFSSTQSKIFTYQERTRLDTCVMLRPIMSCVALHTTLYGIGSVSDKMKAVNDAGITELQRSQAKACFKRPLLEALTKEIYAYDVPSEKRRALFDQSVLFFGGLVSLEEKAELSYPFERDACLAFVDSNYVMSGISLDRCKEDLEKLGIFIQIENRKDNDKKSGEVVFASPSDRDRVQTVYQYIVSALDHSTSPENQKLIKRKMASFCNTISVINSYRKDQVDNFMIPTAQIPLLSNIGSRDRINRYNITKGEGIVYSDDGSGRVLGIGISDVKARADVRELISMSYSSSTRPVVYLPDQSALIFTNHMIQRYMIIDELGRGSVKRTRPVVLVRDGHVSYLAGSKINLRDWMGLFDAFKESDILSDIPSHPNILVPMCTFRYKGKKSDGISISRLGIPLKFFNMYERFSKMQDIAKGLSHMHLHNRVHGDVKIDNCVNIGGRAVLIDFNFVLWGGGELSTIGGTYYAPECIKARDLRDPSVFQEMDLPKLDSWAWAITFLRGISMGELFEDVPHVSDPCRFVHENKLDRWFYVESLDYSGRTDSWVYIEGVRRSPYKVFLDSDKYVNHSNLNDDEQDDQCNLVFSFQKEMVFLLEASMLKSEISSRVALGRLLISCLERDPKKRASMEDIRSVQFAGS